MAGSPDQAACRISCPVCGAGQPVPPEDQPESCRRCRADLAAWLQTRRSAALHALAAIAAACQGDGESAAALRSRLAWLDPAAAAALEPSSPRAGQWSPFALRK